MKQINTPARKQAISRYTTADTNQALARHADALADAKQLIPRHLRSLTKERILAGRHDQESFSLAQAEMALFALRTVNELIERALHRYGDSNLPAVLNVVSRNAPAELRLLAERQPKRPDRHSLFLYQSASVTLTLATWDPGKWTAWHDHSCERLAFQVVEGYVREMRYEGNRIATFHRSAGNIAIGDPILPHRVGNGNGISLHAYAPCLEHMTRFVEVPSGHFGTERSLQALPE